MLRSPQAILLRVTWIHGLPWNQKQELPSISHLVTLGRMVGGEERWKRHIKPIWAHDFSTTPTSSLHLLPPPTLPLLQPQWVTTSRTHHAAACLMLCRIWFISGWGVPTCPQGLTQVLNPLWKYPWLSRQNSVFPPSVRPWYLHSLTQGSIVMYQRFYHLIPPDYKLFEDGNHVFFHPSNHLSLFLVLLSNRMNALPREGATKGYIEWIDEWENDWRTKVRKGLHMLSSTQP